MGGTHFGKTFGKVTTTMVDPFGINKTKFGKTIRKVVDPLNIMDPLNVLPGKGEKWGTFDKNYGGPAQKWLGINQPAPYTPPKYDFSNLKKSNNSQMMTNLLNQQKQATVESINNFSKPDTSGLIFDSNQFKN